MKQGSFLGSMEGHAYIYPKGLRRGPSAGLGSFDFDIGETT